MLSKYMYIYILRLPLPCWAEEESSCNLSPTESVARTWRLGRQNDTHNHEIAVLAWMEVALDLVNAADEPFNSVMGGEGFGQDGFRDLSRGHIGNCDAALKPYVSFHVNMALWCVIYRCFLFCFEMAVRLRSAATSCGISRLYDECNFSRHFFLLQRRNRATRNKRNHLPCDMNAIWITRDAPMIMMILK